MAARKPVTEAEVAGGKVRSVARAVGILKAFLKPPHEWGITELSEQLGLAKGTVHLLVKTLEDEGFLEQVPEGRKYRLGKAVHDLAMVTLGRADVRALARGYLNQLCAELAVPCYLAMRIGGKAVLVEKAEPLLPFMVVLQVGAVLPYHSSALGKVLLAYAPEPEREQILLSLAMPASTRRTITDPEALRVELATVVQQGYALDREETLPGVFCVAVPVWGRDHTVAAALAVAATSATITDRNYHKYLLGLKKYAELISRSLR